MFKKKNLNVPLIILAFIMLINALSSGIIIPLLYPYSAKFGINPLGLSLLFVSYSLFQFLATPIIGRLSDRFGRKPMLLISIFGTSLSLALFASAQSVQMLFIARILDGITGGNISVAQAMIADKTSGNDRAKGFGILGAMFGLGFLIGPAIGGFMSTISLSAPFWLASLLALIATILGFIILRETLSKKKVVKQKSEPFFNYRAMVSALFSPTIGFALIITLVSYSAHQAIIIAFQAYTVDVLKLGTKAIGTMFTVVGLVVVFIRSVGIKFVVDRVSNNRKIISTAFLISAIIAFLITFSDNAFLFLVLISAYTAAYAFINPVTTSIISKNTNEEDQGVALGITQSYISLGQILGPISAGIVSQFNIRYVFVWSSLLLFGGFLLSHYMKRSSKKADF